MKWIEDLRRRRALRRSISSGSLILGERVTMTDTSRIQPHSPIHGISIGDDSHIAGQLLVMCGTGSISVGRECFVGEGARVWSASRVEIGDRVLIAHGVQMFDNRTHPLDARERHQQAQALLSRGEMPDARLLDGKPIRVAEDAWIGANSIIGRGLTIGAASIVAAGSVVTRDVPAGAIVGGNPARLLEERS